ncbi:MAG: hypothetical protein J4O05_02160 [Chloroflexi bacterium]|nr:hypothetical protein [Chloroflexota bacterium]
MAIDDERWVVFGTPVRYSGEDGRSELATSLATITSAGERQEDCAGRRARGVDVVQGL